MCLNEIKGVTSTKPEGAFHVFPKIHGVGKRWETDKDFVLELLKSRWILLVHGSGFDPKFGAGNARVVILPPIEMLERVFSELEHFMKGARTR